jgi:tyrosinase
MSTHGHLRVRRSLADLQNEYSSGNKKPLEDLMRAWKGIKDLPADNPRSFFVLGGYHGEPFRGAGWGNSTYWGGYCNHGNILFPVWHRIYLVKLEEALQSIPGCEEVMLPFWDETSDDSVKNGIPWALTVENFTLDGKNIPNPLRSFVFNHGITDNINGDNPNYSKPFGYETVRYPLSGLVGTDADRQKTAEHNAKYPNYDQNVLALNQNVVNWLNTQIVVDGKSQPTDVKEKYTRCLDAPNYTVFSNTSSAQQWNDDLGPGVLNVVPLEEPHNDIHLAVGGFDAAGTDVSPIEDANGDMGENDTAGLDPIFFFHHCFVDRVFWLWQKRNGYTDHLDVIPEYPGTNSVDSQGPTPGVVPNSWLTLESPLDPFKLTGHGKLRPYTALDAIDIEKQLGYTYGPGSLDQLAAPVVKAAAATVPAGKSAKKIRVSALNRARIRGSFMVSAFVTVAGQRHHVGTRSILSRWSVQGCANCQTHLEVKAHFDLDAFTDAALAGARIEVEVRTRDGILDRPRASATPLAVVEPRPFRVDVR